MEWNRRSQILVWNVIVSKYREKINMNILLNSLFFFFLLEICVYFNYFHNKNSYSLGIEFQ